MNQVTNGALGLPVLEVMGFICDDALEGSFFQLGPQLWDEVVGDDVHHRVENVVAGGHKVDVLWRNPIHPLEELFRPVRSHR